MDRTVSGGKGAKTRQVRWIPRPAIKVVHQGPSGGQEQIRVPICSCIKKGHPEAPRCQGACHRLPGGPSIKSSGSLRSSPHFPATPSPTSVSLSGDWPFHRAADPIPYPSLGNRSPTALPPHTVTTGPCTAWPRLSP